MVLRMVALSGGPREMGLQLGKEVRSLTPHIRELFDAVRREIGENLSLERLVGDMRAVVERHSPEFMEMLEGVAEGAWFARDILFETTCSTFLRHMLHYGLECSVWAVRAEHTVVGEPILAKNRDKRVRYKPLHLFVYARPRDGLAYFASTNAGDPGVAGGGMNERGLTVFSTYVASSDIGVGLPDNVLAKMILESCSTVEEAIDLLKSVPRLGQFTFTLGDSKGDIAVVEVGYSELDVEFPESGYAFRTNHFKSARMSERYYDPYHYTEYEREDTLARWRHLDERVRGALGTIDLNFVKRLMRYHDPAGHSICRHVGEGDVPIETVASMIALPRRTRILFAEGPPCEHPYMSLDLGGGMP